MKLILRQYLSDIRERGELDAILPALLSELGFNVLSKPGRGTRQAGVDIAAVGPDENDNDRKKLFLFVVKSGDLGRHDWDSTPQSVRQSLNEILDSYIPSRIPEYHQDLDIVVCLCMGGEMKENVQTQWTGYVNQHCTNKISYREWNGDKLAGLLLSGVLRQELLEVHLQKHFQKSVAMVDHPDVSYRFFVNLIQGLLKEDVDEKEQITRLRQVYICLWVLFVWAREAGNLESPLRASEYTVLQIWNYCRSIILEEPTKQNDRLIVLDQVIKLYLIISEALMMDKLAAYVDKPFALSMAVTSQSSVDVNMALFEQLGRFSLYGLWQYWLACSQIETDDKKYFEDRCVKALEAACLLIKSNPTLMSPICDDFAIEVTLFMNLAQICNAIDNVSAYLEDMAQRLRFSIDQHFSYPVSGMNYYDLIEHSHDRSEEYLKEHTRGSILYPLLIAWLDKLCSIDARNILTSCIERHLSHTTQQVWVPDGETDEMLWKGDLNHGVAITVQPCESPQNYAALLNRIITDHSRAYDNLSTTKNGLWPILLMACRHFRLPVPPHLWFSENNNQGPKEKLTVSS